MNVEVETCFTEFCLCLLLVLPKIVDSPINRSLTSPTDLSFSCRAIGYPLPNVTWTRSLGDINETMMAVNTRNESLRSVTSKLYLPKANISNAGKYTCTANDEVHEGIESSSGFLFGETLTVNIKMYKLFSMFM